MRIVPPKGVRLPLMESCLSHVSAARLSVSLPREPTEKRSSGGSHRALELEKDWGIHFTGGDWSVHLTLTRSLVPETTDVCL